MIATTAKLIDLWRIRLSVLGLAAFIAALIGGCFHAQRFFVSYLAAYFFWFGLAVGCALIMMVHQLTGGRWGHPVRRILEAGLATLPLMALLFVPVLLGLSRIYPWVGNLTDPEIHKKSAYLNRAFFMGRAVLYFVIWSLFAWKLRTLSIEQDKTTDPTPTRRMVKHSAAGLVIFPLLATFAYIDWVMSIEPRWHSTIFPLVILAGQMLVGYAFVIVAARIFDNEPALQNVATKARFHQLGNLLLTFVLFWTYLAFAQLLVIYSANEPKEIAWYLHRLGGGWKGVGAFVVLFNFFVPFALLLFRAAKRSETALPLLAASLLAVQLLYTYWLIVPSFPELAGASWMDLVTPVAVGAIWLGAFLWLLNRAPLVPLNDPRTREEMLYAD